MQIHIYASKNVSVKGIGSWASMVLLNYQNFIEMPSNMNNIFALAVGFKCPRKINLNTQWDGSMHPPHFFTLLTVVPFINAAPLYTLSQIALASAVPEASKTFNLLSSTYSCYLHGFRKIMTCVIYYYAY